MVCSEGTYMDLRQLKYFVTVVEEKTVTAAAQKLSMTQPPLTSQLHSLEEELGCKLFFREGRCLRPNEAGMCFYSRALEILGMCDSAREEMTQFKKGARGTLNIGVVSSVQGTVFTALAREYSRLHPSVVLSVFSANTYELLEKLRNHNIDMAMVRTPFSAGELETKCLYEEAMTAVGEEKFFKAVQNKKISLEELAEIPVILYRRWQKIVEATFEAKGLSPFVYCVNDDASMTMNLSFAGLGVGIIPPSALPKELPKGIKAVRIDSPALVSKIALVCNSQKQLPEPAKLFWLLASK